MVSRAKIRLAALSIICIIALSSQLNATESTADVDYQIMVQRATQTAIWAMPGVALVDFIKATKRDLGGNFNDVVYLTKPFNSKQGFLTANDVTAYG
jgi:hypothetical protein